MPDLQDAHQENAMTAEQTKPGDEEIDDEQLENVAGGTDVFANGRGISPKASASNTLGFPDVTGIDAGNPGVPVPYPTDDDAASSSPPGSPSGD